MVGFILCQCQNVQNVMAIHPKRIDQSTSGSLWGLDSGTRGSPVQVAAWTMYGVIAGEVLVHLISAMLKCKESLTAPGVPDHHSNISHLHVYGSCVCIFRGSVHLCVK